MKTKVKLDKLTYALMLMVALICLLRGVTLYFWWHMPDIEMSVSPAIYKGVQYPEVSFATLAIGVPCLIVLMTHLLRDLARAVFVSGVLVSFGMISIIGAMSLSFNVAGGGAIFLMLGVQLYRLTITQLSKID